VEKTGKSIGGRPKKINVFKLVSPLWQIRRKAGGRALTGILGLPYPVAVACAGIKERWMHPLLTYASGTKRLLMGNEAIVRGALEAGVGFVTTYPGTPSSEIGDTFYSLSGEAGIQFEYSINEKVAMEVAAGAAVSGVSTLCAMKHVGVNVAADPLMTLAYTGITGAMVIITADDPGCHSSQNEQDNRYYALLSQLPMLEPGDPIQAYEMVREAFALSRKFELPVLLRTTTRVAHSRAVVTVGNLAEPVSKGEFVPDPMRFMPVPSVARLRHPELRKQTAKIKSHLLNSPLDYSFGSGKLGIITSGGASALAEDVVRTNDLTRRTRVLKLGVAHPLNEEKIGEFLTKVSRVLVVEELEPFVETKVLAIAHETGAKVTVYGKRTGHFSPIGEFDPDIVADAILALLNIRKRGPKAAKAPKLPPRPPSLCPGCPHRATYSLVKMAAGDSAHFWSDIGCYTLGFAPPLRVGDMMICMGSSASSSGGVAAATGKKAIGFIGDSTFYHSGMTGLANTLRQNRNVKLVVMDNATTGMTGHQPHPGSASKDRKLPMLQIADIAKGLGVRDVVTVDPKNMGKSLAEIKRVLDKDGPGVIISKSPCPLYARKVFKLGGDGAVFRINHEVCKHCGREGSCHFCGLEPNALTTITRSMRTIQTGAGRADVYRKQGAPKKMEHPPCEAACPARICVQGYVSAIAAGQVGEAIQLIRQRVALPNVLCRVCDRPCEKVCIRGDFDDPISINRLKRFAMDTETDADRLAYAEAALARVKSKRTKIAVIGAGPAGLQCAHDLRLRGYKVTVFDEAEQAGGIARWGIPDQRLPKNALEKDLDVLEAIGVSFEFEKRLGNEIDLAILKKQGYAAGFLAIGQGREAALKIPGEKHEQVLRAIEFLGQVNGPGASIHGKVIVVGGGNAAVDAARAALRCGASTVTILYRRSRKEMPADNEEIEAALAEGIRIEPLAAPTSIVPHGKGLRIACQKMALGKPDRSGRRRPIPIEGKTFNRTADWIISAIGQNADAATLHAATVETDRHGRVKIDAATGATSDRFWYAGGDAVTGPASLVRALEAGKIAAYGIDKSLSKRPVSIEVQGDVGAMLAEERYKPNQVEAEARVNPAERSVKTRVRNFAEVESTYSREQAEREALRCLTCGTCASCNNCIDNFGCPAFYKDGDKLYINPILCDGCGTCVQICPNGAIEIVPQA
jgi:indolepyruvate ferredoxin oxidoreductase, alpha subunit